jgi:hypothetical protein
MIDILQRFLNIEEILYTIPHYRDHFFHQIKVFLLGFCIINTLNREGRLKSTLLSQSDGMKLWFMTSAFHDVGYPFEKMAGWLDRFIEGVLRNPMDKTSEKLVPITFDWGALLGRRFHAYHLLRIVEQVCSLYGRQTSEVLSEVLSELTSGTVDRADHGLFSSLILQNFLAGPVKDEEVVPVALAVALHNPETAQVVRKIVGVQSFEKDPLSFLLAFCDIAQDWGRTRPSGFGQSAYRTFGYPMFDADDIYDSSSRTIHIGLRYDWSMSVADTASWRTDVFYKYIRPVRDWWRVGPAGLNLPHFRIDYFHNAGSLEQLEF